MGQTATNISKQINLQWYNLKQKIKEHYSNKFIENYLNHFSLCLQSPSLAI